MANEMRISDLKNGHFSFGQVRSGGYELKGETNRG